MNWISVGYSRGLLAEVGPRYLLDGDIALGDITTVKIITYTLAARRGFRKIPGDMRAQIESKLARFAKTGAGDVKSLTGQPGARLRVGDYRVIFVETDTSIEIRAVGHRRDIYR
ncbi:mRNA interferase RelE/StbE [Rhizobiales bacterium GAS188]|nr:mRNA interferase RelE/StbE [Rhizobiales bacterium GAS188]